MGILSLYLKSSTYLVAPLFIGSEDIWYGYYVFDSQLLQSGQIPSNLWYSDFPIFHLITSIFNITTTSNFNIFPIFLLSSISFIFIFIIIRKLISIKVGLVSALIFIIMPHMISWGTEPHPMSLSLILLIIGIYVLFKRHESDHLNALLLLIFIFIIIIDIMCHTIGSLVFLLFIFADIMAQITVKSFNNRKFQNIFYSTFITTLLILIAYWMYVANKFFFNIAEFVIGKYSYPSSLGQIQSIGIDISLFNVIINNLGIFIVFFFALIGGLFLFKANIRQYYTIVYFCTILYLLQLFLASEVISIGTIPYRLDVFLHAIIPIPFAFGFIIMFKNVTKTKKRFIVSIFFLFIIIFFLITSVKTGDESAPFQSTTLNQVTYSELSMERFVNNSILPINETLFLDLITSRIIFKSDLDMDLKETYYWDNIGENGFFLVSLRSIIKGTDIPVDDAKSSYVRQILSLIFLDDLSLQHNMIYDDGGAKVYN
jgi:hypothetical protein